MTLRLRPRLSDWFPLAFLLVSASLASAQLSPILHPTLDYTSSWIGNRFNVVTPGIDTKGKPELNYKWVQKDGNGLAVAPDGTCYASSGWDEAGKGVGIDKDGDDLGKCAVISVGGKGIGVDDKYVYVATPARQPKGSPQLYTIARWLLDGNPGPREHLDAAPTFAHPCRAGRGGNFPVESPAAGSTTGCGAVIPPGSPICLRDNLPGRLNLSGPPTFANALPFLAPHEPPNPSFATADPGR